MRDQLQRGIRCIVLDLKKDDLRKNVDDVWCWLDTTSETLLLSKVDGPLFCVTILDNVIIIAVNISFRTSLPQTIPNILATMKSSLSCHGLSWVQSMKGFKITTLLCTTMIGTGQCVQSSVINIRLLILSGQIMMMQWSMMVREVRIVRNQCSPGIPGHRSSSRA